MENPAQIENITIFWGKHRGPLIYSNTFVVETGKTPVIIDPGGESDDLKKMSEKKAFIVNTHFHGDHRRLNYLLPGASSLPRNPMPPCFRATSVLSMPWA